MASPSETIGLFPPEESLDQPISLTLSPDARSLPWSLCHHTANLVAERLKRLLSAANREEISSAAGYVLNELLENAVKFNHHGSITVTVGLGHDELICLVGNQIGSDAVPSLREHLQALLSEDPGEQLRRRAEANAASGAHQGSGLGYPSIIHDYGVSLGWKIDAVSTDTVRLQTRARLPV